MSLTRYVGFTLVDITPTGVTRSTADNELERNQQRNWETVLQCIGLRTQPLDIELPEKISSTADKWQFGELYSGAQDIWQWSWSMEREGVYDLLNKPLGGLLQDFEQVPIITNLTETARFMLPIFYPYGTIKNIYFKQVYSG